jgi:long-chain fatty acid transport protein
MPQSLLGGMYHQLRGGVAITVDLLWFDFSEFEISQASTGESSIVEVEQPLEDILAATVGVRVPVGDRWEVRAGALHITQPIKDENRTFLLRLDRIWGVGAGFRREIGGRGAFSMSLNLFDLGDAPLTTPDLPLVGSISGEYSTHRGATLDLWYSRRLGKKASAP